MQLESQTESKQNVDPNEDLRPLVRQAWGDLQAVAVDAKRNDLLEPFLPAMERFELGIFRLVVMGEIKKGKSSFINALLNESDLLPTSSDIATSTVFKLMYGPKLRMTAFFLQDVDSGKRPSPREISASDLATYGSEDGNPDNERRVDFIGVELPHPLLHDGLVLVDTPGVGGLFKAHRDVTWRYAPNADAVFFVLDSVEAVISQDEIKFLQELTSKITQRVFFVQTKIDAVGAEQADGWRDRNKQILMEKLGIPADKLYYFPVSAKLKRMADERQSSRYLQKSGFLTVVDFLHRGLMRAKGRELAIDTACRLSALSRELRADAQEKHRIAAVHSREELDRISQEYSETRTRLETWDRTTLQPEVQQFREKLDGLRRQGMARLQDELDPTGTIVRGYLEQLRKSEFDPRKVSEEVGQIQQSCIATAAEKVGQIQQRFNDDVAQMIQSAIHRLAIELPPDSHSPAAPQSAALFGPTIALETSLNMSFSSFEDMRTSMYGGMAGAMLANLGVGLVSIVFPPAAAVAGIAAIIGGMIGGSEASKASDSRRREETISKLNGVLQDTMRKAQRQAVQQFDESVRSFDRQSHDLFRSAADRFRNETQERLAAVEKARGQSREQQEKQRTDLEERLRKIDRIDVDLDAILAKRFDRRREFHSDAIAANEKS